ncbi:tRNA (N6-threonylcarbamoyladenosine(37)-N6)-methyltransferase TrmO [Breoghania sp.]|uniref:tRNA (N6-threonylcarbamoyladenosine(37)-N6)-methyltransferase TrmO n=1 Tax=Breoghania sp. TaxID=2065378 RepID=UPI002AA7B3F5|nr:tRNA (N6-threonylcarbamoyladenosine(37)-N6)-methyltransferase TrmO [Breoghania sp.]
MKKRPGEIALPFDPAETANDATVTFIGRILTPWPTRKECPRRGAGNQEICRIELDEPYHPGLKSVEGCSHLYVLYWMHEAPRNLIIQSPAFDQNTHGVFALRSPARPNPIALSVVDLLKIDGGTLEVRGLDCVSGTPLLDIKPYFSQTDARPEAKVEWRGHAHYPSRQAEELPQAQADGTHETK